LKKQFFAGRVFRHRNFRYKIMALCNLQWRSELQHRTRSPVLCTQSSPAACRCAAWRGRFRPGRGS
jgi:hypothetical protein